IPSPPDGGKAEQELTQLVRNVGPLYNDSFDLLVDFGASARVQAIDQEIWLRDRMMGGYYFVTQRMRTVEATTALYRGPFIPQPESTIPGVSMASLYGTDLVVVDRFTGMLDISYQAAWDLGVSLAQNDVTVSTALMSLRRRLHIP